MVKVTFFGVTTLLLDDGATRILTDGFFSRPAWWRLFFPLRPDISRINFALRRVPKPLDAIFVAHSHYDHAMDTATVARLRDAQVYGSQSTANVMCGEGLDMNDVHVFQHGDAFSFGSFKVSVFKTPHSADAFYPGEIEGALQVPARARDYREGGNYSFFFDHPERKVLVVTSCNYSCGMFRGVQAKMVFLAVGQLGRQSVSFAEAFWNETVVTVGAETVVPIHWDNFTKPLEPFLAPQRIRDNFRRGWATIAALSRQTGVNVRWPQAFEVF